MKKLSINKRESRSGVAEQDSGLPEKAPRWMKTLFEGAQRVRESAENLPNDMAVNHDHYAHGASKRA